MQTTSLRKGENTVLSVSVQGLSADVSALLLGADGKVRADHDLVPAPVVGGEAGRWCVRGVS
ncbi:hypothetical protein [Streptomyces sp. NPDC055189]